MSDDVRDALELMADAMATPSQRETEVVANCPDCGWDFLLDEPRDCPACTRGVQI